MSSKGVADNTKDTVNVSQPLKDARQLPGTIVCIQLVLSQKAKSFLYGASLVMAC